MRVILKAALVAVSTALSAACHMDAYREDVYFQTDGSGELHLNASAPALHVFFELPEGPLTTGVLRSFFDGPGLNLLSVSQSETEGRTFFHLRAAFDHVNALSEHPAFTGRRLRLREVEKDLQLVVEVDRPGNPAALSQWPASDRVALRFHIPGPIFSHDSPAGIQRGNVLVWEREASNFFEGAPPRFQVRFERRSVLEVTLTLLARALTIVVITIATALAILTRIGRRQLREESSTRA